MGALTSLPEGFIHSCMDVSHHTAKGVVSGNKKVEQGLACRQRILDAAECVFFEKGVSSTTLEMIAERAEVTRGAIYWHFKNKHEILEEVLDASALPLLERFRQVLHGDPKPNVDTLRKAGVETLLMIARSAPLRRRMTIALLRCEYTDENVERMMARERSYDEVINDLMIRYLKSVVAHDKNLALARPPRILAQAFCCYWTGVVTQFLKDPQSVNLARHAGDYMDVFLMPMFVRRDAVHGKGLPVHQDKE